MKRLAALALCLWFPSSAMAQRYYEEEPLPPRAKFQGRPTPKSVLAATPAPPQPSAPAVLDHFIAMPFNQALPSSQQFYPPDTMGAVGVNEIVAVTNSEIRYLTRSGVELAGSRQRLDAFWNGTSGGTFIAAATESTGFAYDVKIVFDKRAGSGGRFFFVCLAGPKTGTNQLMLAVSKSSNPSDGWWGFHQDYDGTDTNWLDYPGLGIGTQWVVVTGANFKISGNCGKTVPDSPYCGVDLFKFDKASLITNDPAPPTFTMTKTAFTFGVNNAAQSILMPTVDLDGTAADVYFVQSGWVNNGNVPPTAMVALYRLDAAGTFTQLNGNAPIDVTDYNNPPAGAPQQGTLVKIEVGDFRILNAVVRNNHIWSVNTGGFPATGTPNQTEVVWSEFSTAGAKIQDGLIRDAAGAFYWYPSIGVDEFENVAIGFTGSGSGLFAGAYYTGCFRGGTTCTMQSVLQYRAGESTYNVPVGGLNRWGDYSSTFADPSVAGQLWTIQERASASANQYETHMARLSLFPSPTTPPPGFAFTPFAAPPAAQTLAINWTSDTNATAYEVTKDVTGCSTVVQTIPYNGALSFSAAGLNPNQTLSVCVRSVNPNGTGPTASVSTTTFAQAPTGVSLGRTATSVTANFTPPSPTSFAQGYQAEAYANGACTGAPDKVVVVNDATVSFVDIPNLLPTTNYCVKVGALNARGAITYVAGTNNITTDTLLLPPAPLAPSNVTDVSIRANWASGGNPTATLYSATASVTSDFSGPIITSTTFNLFADFTGLSPNTTYFFKVAPASAPAKVANLAAIATLSQAPSLLAFKNGDPTTSSATLSFSKGSNPNPGTTYFLEIDGDASFPAPIALSVCGGAAFCSSLGVTGLPSNTPVFFRLRSFNRAGALSPPATVDGATLPHAPINPQYIAVTFSSASVKWTISPCSTCTRRAWRLEAGSAAGNFGGTIPAMTIYDVNASAGGLDGLDNNSDYLFRVGAIGVDGRINFTNFAFATHTALAVFSTQTITSTGAVLSFTPTYPEISNVSLAIPPGALPGGTQVKIDSSVQYLVGPVRSNQGKIFAVGPTVAVDIKTDSGQQPRLPPVLRFTYNAGLLPPGKNPADLHVCYFDPGPQVWDILPSRIDPAANTVEADLPHFSLFAPFFVTAGVDLSGVEIFPVPWEPGSGGLFDAPGVTFTNMPPSANVRLYTIKGELVWEAPSDLNGVLRWDGRTRKGTKAASGVYLVNIVAGGKRLLRRVVVTR